MVCVNAPICRSCSLINPNECTLCADGYFLRNGGCLPCQSYCKVCISETKCEVLFNSEGYVLVEVNSSANLLARCDNGCAKCSAAYPGQCY